MVNPRIGGTVCDPACGSGGFLIAAYEHILLANTSQKFIFEKIGYDGLTLKIGIGDRLSRAHWDFLQKGTFHGFDGDQDILRMAAMNTVLHGFDQLPIIQQDSICGSEDKWDEIQFNYILENPPFSGSRGDAKRSLRIENGDKVRALSCPRSAKSAARRHSRDHLSRRHSLWQHHESYHCKGASVQGIRSPGRSHST